MVLDDGVRDRQTQTRASIWSLGRVEWLQHDSPGVPSPPAQPPPVISVDTKKKELVGDFKNAGREWRPQGSPERVRVHDFIIPEQGKAIPYGVYDLSRPTTLSADDGYVCTADRDQLLEDGFQVVSFSGAKGLTRNN